MKKDEILPIGKINIRGESMYIETVSYTHLDVYKRQVFPQGKNSENSFKGSGNANKPILELPAAI